MARAWRNLEAALVAGIDYVAIRARESNVTLHKLGKKNSLGNDRRIFANSEKKYDITVHVEKASVAEIRR